MKEAVLLVAALSLLGCGASHPSGSPPLTGSNPGNPPPASLPLATSMIVIGNSISYHGPSPSIGWTGNWGMAASAALKDYVHISSSALNLPATVYNGAPAEQDPAANGPALIQLVTPAITPKALVVVELGDNVTSGNLPVYAPVYQLIAKAASSGAAVICLSTWWGEASTDAAEARACRAAAGVYVPIGDIFTDPNNPDYEGPPAFSDPGVQRHPHDWSMNQIAGRVVAAARGAVNLPAP